MKNKATTIFGLLATGLLTWGLVSAPAAGEEDKDAGDKPGKKAVRDSGDKPDKQPPGKDAAGPDAKPAAKGGPKPATKPARKPPAKKDDLGISPDDPWLESQAARTKLSAHVLGPPLGPADLKGQVLLVVHWDSNREKTRRLLPALVRLDSQYRSKGLTVVGVRRHNRDRGAVISTARQYGVRFSVYGGALVPDTNFDKFMKLKTPYCYVLDHTGKVILEDRPGGRMTAAIQSALRKRPNPLIGQAKYPKSAAILAKIRAGKLGEAVALCKKAQEKQGQAAEEAAALLANLERNAERLLAKAKKAVKQYPQYALATLAQVKKEYAGTPFGEEAEAKLKELSQDETLQKEIQAERESRPMIRALGSIPKYPYNASESRQRSWARKYGPTLKAAKSRIARLSKKYPDTKALRQAEAMLKEVWPEKPLRPEKPRK